MATILRAPLVTAVALLSTTVAINSQPAQNRLILQPPPRSLKDFPSPVARRPVPYVQDVRNRHVFLPAPDIRPNVQSDWPTPLAPIRSIIADAILNPNVFLLKPVGTPFVFSDWPSPAQITPKPSGLLHHRPQLGPIVAPPFSEYAWTRPASARPPILVEPFRNGLVLPLPAVGTPFRQQDWGTPARLQLKPETFLFYYIQDQTSPAFIQYDWPRPARVPSLIADPIPNRILFPFVAPSAPFRQQEWPSASRGQIAKIVDPYNRNVFLPIPQGQPTRQTDWPRPRDPQSLQPGHTINDIGILSVPVATPFIPGDWPLPRRVLMLTVIWEREGTSPIFLPTFKPEWAQNVNQYIGKNATQPVTK